MFIIETFYLVDYENVHGEGLVGCKDLKMTDHVVIFFTPNAKNMDMRNLSGVESSNIQYIEVPAGKQSADIHIGSYMGYLIGKSQSKIKIIVVSKDTDYDKLIAFWRDKADLSRKEKIEEKKVVVKQPKQTKTQQPKAQGKKSATASETKTKLNMDIQRALSAEGYDNKVISAVAKLVVKRYGKENFKRDIHEDLRKLYTDFDDVYKVIKGVLTQYC